MTTADNLIKLRTDVWEVMAILETKGIDLLGGGIYTLVDEVCWIMFSLSSGISKAGIVGEYTERYGKKAKETNSSVKEPLAPAR